MGTSLEDALDPRNASEKEPEAPVEDQQAAPEPEVEAQVDETPQQEPEPSDEEPKGWQYAAYKDEKTKRQELEASLREQEQKFAEIQRQNAELQQFYQQQQAQQQRQANPEQFDFQQQLGQTLQQQAQNARLDASEFAARSTHGDDKVNAALKALQGLNDNGATMASIRAESHPWDAMVKWHAKQEALASLGDDPQAAIQAQAEELAKQMLAEMQQIPAAQTPATQTPTVMPTDLSQTRNVGSRSGSNWSGPTALGDALGEKS